MTQKDRAEKNKSPPLEGGRSHKIDEMCNITHDIISPKLYELILRNELKVYTSFNLENLYNHLNMYVNEAIKLREYIFPSFKVIKNYITFHEHFPQRLCTYLIHLILTNLCISWILTFIDIDKLYLYQLLHITTRMQGCHN